MSEVKFYDEKARMICEYNPQRSKLGHVKHRIGEKEELIGVYGVKGFQSYFTSFGFLVKVRQ